MQPSEQALTLLTVALLLYVVKNVCFLKQHAAFWDSQPNIGLRNQWLAWLRGTLRSCTHIQKWAQEGYDKYSTDDVPFVIPTMDRGPLVIIPPAQIKKVYALTDTVLDVHNTQDENLQLEWTVWDKDVIEERLHVNVIHNQLNRNLVHVSGKIYQEIEFGFNRMWGTGSQWKEVKVWDTALKIIAGAANGVFCGKPLCRNPKFLDALRDHAMGIFGSALVIGCTPRLLQPIPGIIAAHVCEYLFQKAAKIALPFIEERLANTAKLKANHKYEWSPPNDGLQWIIDECYGSSRPSQLDPKRVCHRLLLINDVSLHTTAFTMQDFILNLFSTDPSLGYVEILREECATVLGEAGGVWTRNAVEKLKLVDSAIRESMRLSPVGTIMLPRKVKHTGGLPLRNAKYPVPVGTDISVPIQPIHHDESIYPEARRYLPFRFAEPEAVLRIRGRLGLGDTEKSGRGAGEPPAPKQEEARVKSTVMLDEDFLSFGVSGKHACPGRFFALVEMKLFVAHLLLNYEVEYLQERPAPVNIIWLNHPSNATVRVRKRITAP
ncbi:hypothetical protein DL769_008483 [Monosporascus sp. CRB-8-3]|nr:hypothetical protein DL769_008483 [Monosporascus sp. CRB-8-3]